MKTIFLILSSTMCFCWTRGFSTLSLYPYRKDIPEQEYKNHITVHLVTKTWEPVIERQRDLPQMKNPNGPSAKNWKPEIELIPVLEQLETPDEPLARYPYDKDAALTVLYANKKYDSCSEKLASAASIITNHDCGYKSDLESVMIVTTLSGNANDHISKNIIFAMAMRNMIRKYNVFVFDMSAMEDSMALTAARQAFGKTGNYGGVSRSFADFIMSTGIKAEGINLIGFCYSAQLIIHVAREIKVQSKQKIKSILSLDPNSFGKAKTLYDGLSPEDAQFLHTYHTNSHRMGNSLRGNAVDIIFNGGNFQPGCGRWIKGIKCSHKRAFVFLWYIIIYPDLFVARECNDWVAFKNCVCNTEEDFSLTFPPSGKKTGEFHIMTSDKSPFGLEKEGSGFC